MHQFRSGILDDRLHKKLVRRVFRKLKEGSISASLKANEVTFSYGGFSYGMNIMGDSISIDIRAGDDSGVREGDLARYVELEVQTNNLFSPGNRFERLSDSLDTFRAHCRRFFDEKASIKCEVLSVPSEEEKFIDAVYDCMVRPALFVSTYRLRFG